MPYRRRSGRRRPRIPVPPNDPYNFFFPNDDCGKFVFRGYTSLPNVEQSSYTREEAMAFVEHVNSNFVISGCWFFGLFVLWIFIHIMTITNGEFTLMFLNMGFLFSIIIGVSVYSCRARAKLEEYLATKNAEL